MRDPELACEHRKGKISCPKPESLYERRCEQVNVDPTNSSPMKFALADESDDFMVLQHFRLLHLFECRESLLPSSAIADQKLTVNEFVPCHFAKRKEPV